jgi:hypothetical protein
MLTLDELADAAARQPDASTRRTFLLALLLRRSAAGLRELAQQADCPKLAGADYCSIAMDLDELADVYEAEALDPKGGWS